MTFKEDGGRVPHDVAPINPLQTLELKALSPADSLELALRAAERSLKRSLPAAFPVKELRSIFESFALAKGERFELIFFFELYE